MSADLIIILALVAMLLLLLPNKKAQEAKMEKDYDNMMKEGNFTGLKTMFRKQFLIWGILFLIALTVSVIRLIQEGDIKGWTELIIAGFFGYRTFILGRAYKSFKNAEKYLSYRLSDEEIERFWKASVQNWMLACCFSFPYHPSGNRPRQVVMLWPSSLPFLLNSN